MLPDFKGLKIVKRVWQGKVLISRSCKHNRIDESLGLILLEFELKIVGSIKIRNYELMRDLLATWHNNFYRKDKEQNLYSQVKQNY